MNENILSFEAYLDEVRHQIQNLYPQLLVLPVQTTKRNGAVWNGITMRDPDINAAPTLYLNDLYEDYKEGMPIAEIIHKLQLAYEEHRLVAIDLDWICDYKNVKEKIAYSLLNWEENAESLKDRPYEPYLDMVKVYAVEVDADKTMAITDKHIAMWGVTEADIKRDAERNTPVLRSASFKRMEEFLFADGAAPPEIENNPTPLYVLTNEDRFLGAACMAYDGMAEQIYEKIGPYCVMPSSVHELIIVGGEVEANELVDAERVVQDANVSCVSQEDYLGDHVYVYDVKSRSIQPVYSDHWVKMHGGETALKSQMEQLQKPRKPKGR